MYKFLKIASYYKGFLTYFYNKYPEIESLSFNEYYNLIMNEKFSWSNFFQIHLAEVGAEANELIYNDKIFLKKWAVENNIDLNQNLVLEYIKKLKPEVIFFQDSLGFSREEILNIKENVPSLKKTIGWSCSPFSKNAIDIYKTFDFIFVCYPRFVDRFQSNGIKVYEINHGFEESIIANLDQNNHFAENDMIFIGSFINNLDYHKDRLEVIENILENNIKLKIYGNIKSNSYLNIKLQQYNFNICNFLKNSGLDYLASRLPKIKKSYSLTAAPKFYKFSKKFQNALQERELYGIDMYKALYKSKFGLNIHGGIAGDYAANMRMYEVAGVGSCLITDYKKNIKEFFEPDVEIVTFNSKDECIEKIKYLFNHPKERTQIAKNGQIRVLKQHTLKSRILKIDEIIKKELNS